MRKAQNNSKEDSHKLQQEGSTGQERQAQEEELRSAPTEEGDVSEQSDIHGESEGMATEASTELEGMRRELEETKERLLRQTAEFDNYRKRTNRERAALISQASGRTLEALLPIVDDFDRAQEHCAKSNELAALIEGLDLIRKSLQDFLKKEGIEEIEAVGLELDTDLHDAVAKVPAPEEKLRGKIVDVTRKGYKLHGRVLRHAQVVVGE